MFRGSMKRHVAWCPIADAVGQSELLPCLAARIIWAERLRNRQFVNYIDNAAARFAMIKGGPPTKGSAWVAGATWDQGAKVGAFSWF